MTLMHSTYRAPSSHGFFMSVLKRQVGHGRRFMPKQFAELIGAAVPTVKGWLAGQGSPAIDRLPKIEAVAGEDLMRDLLAELGYAGAYKITNKTVCPNAHATELANALRELLAALEDRRIDHQERPKLIPIFRKLASEAAHFADTLTRQA